MVLCVYFSLLMLVKYIML